MHIDPNYEHDYWMLVADTLRNIFNVDPLWGSNIENIAKHLDERIIVRWYLSHSPIATAANLMHCQSHDISETQYLQYEELKKKRPWA